MKKKILHIAFNTLGNGGVANVIMSIILTLNNDYDFSVLCYNEPIKKRKTQLSENKAKYISIRPIWTNTPLEPIFRPLIYFFKCINIFCKENFDVVHCHDSSEGGIILLAAKLCGVKQRIMHSHNTHSPMKRRNLVVGLYRSLQRKLFLSCANVFVGCSENACTDLFGNKPHKVINNSIDVSKFLYNKPKPGKYRFIHVGRMTFQKNQSMVIDVFNEILKTFPTATLTFIGEGEDLPKIKEKAINLGISECVEFLPANADVAAEFKKTNFLIFPSKYEGFGIVLLEAQAANVVCFASNECPSVTNIGLCRYIPLSLSAHEWASKIIDDIKSGISFSANRELIKDFDSSVIAGEYRSLYE